MPEDTRRRFSVRFDESTFEDIERIRKTFSLKSQREAVLHAIDLCWKDPIPPDKTQIIKGIPFKPVEQTTWNEATENSRNDYVVELDES